MKGQLFKPSPKVIEWASRLSRHAHQPWVALLFAVLFFLDALFMVVPADGLVAVAVLFAPKKKKIWWLASALGSFVALVLFFIVAQTTLTPYLIEWIESSRFVDYYQSVISSPESQGYFNLSLATISFVPPAICLLAGLAIKLNPIGVFITVIFFKSLRIWLLMEIVRKLWSALIVVSHKLKDEIKKEFM